MAELDVPRISEKRLLEAYRTYLADRGCEAIKIPEGSVRTPDLEVTLDGLSFLNEFKAPELIQDSVSGMYLHRTTYSKLTSFVHTAVKQLRTHDPDHAKPWIVSFASCHFQLNWSNFREVLQGGMVLPEGQLLADFRPSKAFQRWLEDRKFVDLYIWHQINPETGLPYQVSLFPYQLSPHLPAIDRLTMELRKRPVSTEDNNLAYLG